MSKKVTERSRLIGSTGPRPPYLRQSSILSSDSDFSGPRTARFQSPDVPEVQDFHLPERGSARPDAKSYWAYYIPAMSWIPKYKLEYLFGDICAGLTIASFQIPISMSYATSLAFVPTVCGLYGLVVPPMVYALMGSVPQMVVGPEGAISLVVGQAMTKYVHHPDQFTVNPTQVAGLIAGTGGAILLAAGLFRLGFLDSVLSQALLRGFISGVGLVMVIDQVPAQLGLDDLMHKVTGTHPSTMGKARFVLQNLDKVHGPTAWFAFPALIAIVVSRFLKKRHSKRHNFLTFVPEILLVVVISTIICDYFDLDQLGIKVVGHIRPPRVHFEFPFMPSKWQDIKRTFSAAFFASLLGFFESTVAAKTLGSRYDLSISTNRELVALGVVNLVGSLVSALPSFGGYGRSKVNALAGAKTQVSGIVLSVVTMLCIAYAMPYFFYLPSCVLSTVISAVGISLLEEAPNDLKFYWKIRGWAELFTLFVTFLFTVFWSAEVGVAFGVLVSLLRVVHHATRTRIQILGRIPGTSEFRNADEIPDDLESVPGSLIVKIPEPLTFANAGDLRGRLRRFEFYGSMRVHPSFPRLLDEHLVRHIIIDCRGMTEIDSSAAQILVGIIDNYVRRGIAVMFARVPSDKAIWDRLERSGIVNLVTTQSGMDSLAFSDSIQDALDHIDILDSRASGTSGTSGTSGSPGNR